MVRALNHKSQSRVTGSNVVCTTLYEVSRASLQANLASLKQLLDYLNDQKC